MEYSVHPPSPFICSHTHQLLPDWSVPIASVLVVLQPCQFSLSTMNQETEMHKDELRERFLDFGRKLAQQLQLQGYQADCFDPKSGLPVLSAAGALHLDDVAVVRACLGYGAIPQGGCLTVQHPVWDGAVYPSILLSSAPPAILEGIAKQVLSKISNATAAHNEEA